MGVAIVTGGGRGIGAAVSVGAAADGFDVCVVYRARADTAADVVRRCEEQGVRAFAVAADVSEADEVSRVFDAVDKTLGPVTLLVNNVGITAPAARVDEFTAQRVETMLRTNVLSAFLCAGAAVRRMSTRHGGGGGMIVNVSSRAATLGSPGEYVDYAASKAALDTLTVGLAREVAGEGIRVNAVRPGLIHTEIHATTGDPRRVDRLASTVPLGRGGTATEVAAAVLWLASAQASYVTGALLDVSGGR
jgi:NAD(P)-dependent dehydrogenase (short-subunit alcohol dehydrogenase family)